MGHKEMFYKTDRDDMDDFRKRMIELDRADAFYNVIYDQSDPLGEPVHIIEY